LLRGSAVDPLRLGASGGHDRPFFDLEAGETIGHGRGPFRHRLRPGDGDELTPGLFGLAPEMRRILLGLVTPLLGQFRGRLQELEHGR
jgi:hypothetical protein